MCPSCGYSNSSCICNNESDNQERKEEVEEPKEKKLNQQNENKLNQPEISYMKLFIFLLVICGIVYGLYLLIPWVLRNFTL